MLVRRLVYLVCFLAALVFYWAYREWISWIVLLVVVGLPWFSLLVSLPAMLMGRARVEPMAPAELGEKVYPDWHGYGPLPMGALSGKLLVTGLWTGETRKLTEDKPLPTEHCGLWELRLHRTRVRDYLGLFSLPLKKEAPVYATVRPRELAPEVPPDLRRLQPLSWRPKAGGGYSENHELRLYRPGDSLRQVHWKLSAKTGKLVLREPMNPLDRRVILPLELRGTPEELDRLLGRLLWTSRWLAGREISHEIHCLTGDGMTVAAVRAPEDALRAVDRLLQCPLAAPEQAPVYPAGTVQIELTKE